MFWLLVFCVAGFVLLVFFPVPAALGKFLEASLIDDGLLQASDSVIMYRARESHGQNR
jgi:hypothetical protein